VKISSLLTFAAVFLANALLHAQRIQITDLSRSVYGDATTNSRSISDSNLGQFQENLIVTADTNIEQACQTSDMELSGDTLWVTAQANTSGYGGTANAYGGSSLRFSFTISVPYSYFICGNFSGPSSTSSGNEIALFNPFGGPFVAASGSTTFSANGVIPVPGPGNNQFSFEALVQGYSPSEYDNLVISLYPVVGGSIPPPSPILVSSAGAMSVRWPRAVTNLVLEVTTNLASCAWVTDSNTVGASGAFFAVPVDMSVPRQFFRLRLQ